METQEHYVWKTQERRNTANPSEIVEYLFRVNGVTV